MWFVNAMIIVGTGTLAYHVGKANGDLQGYERGYDDAMKDLGRRHDE